MNKFLIAILVAAYCYVSNQDYEDQQIAHGSSTSVIAQNAN